MFFVKIHNILDDSENVANEYGNVMALQYTWSEAQIRVVSHVPGSPGPAR